MSKKKASSIAVSQKLRTGDYKLVLPKRGTKRYDQMLGAAPPEEYGTETLRRLSDEMYEIAAAHGFHEKHVKGQVPPDFGAFCMNLVAEISELWEAYRNGQLDNQCDKKCHLSCAEEELADIAIRTMDTAVQLGVDLGRAVATKAAYNRQREYRHGGKRA
jgi:NTP pyrophosphatase (non-canonical NTP hydrolase)